MSWTKRIQHPSEIMKRGDTVEVVVLKIDKENRRISLGHKQLYEDPWPTLSKNYAVGSDVLGSIVRMLDRGVIVELPGGVEGFVPTNQLGKPDLENPEDAFQIGDELPLQVIEFDQPGRRIVLSVDSYYKKRERNELDQFLAKYPTRTMSMEDAVEGQVEEGEEEKPAEEAKAEQPPAEQPEAEPEQPDSEDKPAVEEPKENPDTPPTPDEEDKDKTE
jgi:small subunit ribosomal protein S1